MDIILRIKELAEADGLRAAVKDGGRTLSYSQLWQYSDRLAVWLRRRSGQSPGACAGRPQRPVAVYGHKSPLMVVCFLAAVRSGRAYCPLDVSTPESRIRDVLEELSPEVVFNTSEDTELFNRTDVADGCTVTDVDEIMRIAGASGASDPEWAVKGDETFYIIFTSGSTGKPKGVRISADCLNNYIEWSSELGCPASEKAGMMFLNQAPFSFDLSVMDLYTCLACGGTLTLMDKDTQKDYARMVKFFRENPLNIWVSTPSFADLCMAEPLFDRKLLPELSIFLFCGEELTMGTYARLRERFPDSRIINTYGPTESTVAVTGVEITDEIYRCAAAGSGRLPAGVPRDGTIISIDSAGEEDSACTDYFTDAAGGVRGEIVIIGDTVSTGYFNDDERTGKAFFETEAAIRRSCGPVRTRGYRTGDTGCIIDGQLYCLGRMDFQVKLHGYRIELGDIEQNLTAIPEIRQAIVLPVERDGKIKSLTAFVVTDTDAGVGSISPDPQPARTDGAKPKRGFVKYIKEQLRLQLPEYMIPKKIVILDGIPVNDNGKADRNRLRSMIS